jgi:hypothetical protein
LREVHLDAVRTQGRLLRSRGARGARHSSKRPIHRLLRALTHTPRLGCEGSARAAAAPAGAFGGDAVGLLLKRGLERLQLDLVAGQVR